MIVTIPDLEILEEQGITFPINGKIFKLKLLSAYYYNIFHSLFIAYLIEFGKIFGKEKITITEDSITIEDAVAENIMFHRDFQALTYQLFVLNAYPERIFAEYRISQMTPFERQIYKQEYKFNKKISRMLAKQSIIGYRDFLKALKPPGILQLYFYLLIVNIQGYKKKVKIILAEMKNRTGLNFSQISITDILSDYFPKGRDQWGKMKIVNGKAVYAD